MIYSLIEYTLEFIEAFGSLKLSKKEEDAWRALWLQVGRQMGMSWIPERLTQDAYTKMRTNWERDEQQQLASQATAGPNVSHELTGKVIRTIAQQRFIAPLRWIVPHMIRAIPKKVRAALHLKPTIARPIIEGILKMRAAFARRGMIPRNLLHFPFKQKHAPPVRTVSEEALIQLRRTEEMLAAAMKTMEYAAEQTEFLQDGNPLSIHSIDGASIKIHSLDELVNYAVDYAEDIIQRLPLDFVVRVRGHVKMHIVGDERSVSRFVVRKPLQTVIQPVQAARRYPEKAAKIWGKFYRDLHAAVAENLDVFGRGAPPRTDSGTSVG